MTITKAGGSRIELVLVRALSGSQSPDVTQGQR